MAAKPFLQLGGWGIALTLFGAAIASPGGAPKAAVSDVRADQQRDFQSKVKPLLGKYCQSCHQGADAPGGIDLTTLSGVATVTSAPDKWIKVGQYVRAGLMPPKGAPLPSFADRQIVSEWFGHATAPDCDLHNPGRVTLIRLNRAEYTNTIRDLLGIKTDAADDFPSDDVGYGFDNIGDVLSTSTLHAEKYISAAIHIAAQTIQTSNAKIHHYRFDNVVLPAGGGFDEDNNVELATNGTVAVPVDIQRKGDYDLDFTAYGDQAGPDFPILILSIDSKPVQKFELKTTSDHPQSYEMPLTLEAGQHQVAFSFTNDYYDAKFPDPKRRDRNVHIRSFDLEGPQGAAIEPSEIQQRLLGPGPVPQDDAQYARGVLEKIETKAYRRPATTDEVDRLLKVYSKVRGAGANFERSMQVCLTVVLSDPNFLFRVERSQGDLTSYELATRLSYFLWSSMPDDQLMEAAAKGDLTKPEGIKVQVERMLQSPKSKSLADEFAAQWLQLRKLEGLIPDHKVFVNATPTLKNAAITETKMLFSDVVNSDRPVTDLLTAQDTFVDGELARFYGIPDVTGPKFVHVKQVDPARGGITGMASFLMVTSNPTRTSPVKRGRFVMEELLGTPPPPPPPNVGVLADDQKSVAEKPIKERMAAHRNNPACANCHRQMDAIGFSLENFDGSGSWRTMDGNFKVDPTGEIADGSVLNGPADLRKMLASRQDEFARAFIEKLATFALGRGLDSADTCAVDDIVAVAKKNNYRFHAIASAIATSDAFRKRT